MNYAESTLLLNGQVTFSDYLVEQSKREMIGEIYGGLVAEQKYLSSRFFYDKTGSALFEKITTLKEYYPTRTEQSILQDIAPKISVAQHHFEVVELGSGDCSKISILFDALPEEILSITRYYPVDISKSALRKSAEILSQTYPGVFIHGLRADFMKHLESIPGEGNRLICFFGSTIGNLLREESFEFLRELKSLMHKGDSLLLGLDMVKEVKVLEAAYNDDQGVTGVFNKNILNVINNITGTNFNPDFFRHVAFYNNEEERIEMHLEADRDMEITSPCFENRILIHQGETIHTENSHKFTPEHIFQLAEKSGLAIEDICRDQNGWFSLAHFKYPD